MTINIEQQSILSTPQTLDLSQIDDGSLSRRVRALCPEYGSAKTTRLNTKKEACHETDDDDTISTSSILSDEETIYRRVSFADQIVTAVWTRPFTSKEEVPNLFYTSEDTSRFRQEFRLEKKLMSELCIDHRSCDSIVFPTTQLSHAYRISRVVVMHNDKLETFVDHNKESEVEGFFDNDSFWSGSITWY